MAALLAAGALAGALLAALPAGGPGAPVAGASSQARSPAAPSSYTKALFLLKRPAGLYRLNRRVADPASPRYRDYRSVERLVKRFGAKRKKRRAAVRWLRSRGFRDVAVDRTRSFVTATIGGSRARRSLALDDGSARQARRAGGLTSAAAPPALAGVVDGVAVSDGTDVFESQPSGDGADAGAPRPGESAGSRRQGESGSSARPRTGTPAGCAEGQAAGSEALGYGFTPNQYLTAYGHQALHDQGIQGRGQRIAVVEIDGFARSDVDAFGECFGIRIPPLTVIPVGIGDPLPPGAETTLDLQVLSAAAPRAKRIDVYEGGASTIDLMRTIAAALGRRGHHPDVVSISLGLCEPGVNGSIEAWRAINNVFALSGAAGISTFVSSGDQGSSACAQEFGDEKAALPLLAVSFPASSPFATAVGGTNFTLDEQNTIASEVTWNDAPDFFGGGGGGRSILVQRLPWWQDGKGFRQFGSNRVVPDVAALADPAPGFAIHCTAAECESFPQENPGWISVGGTSAAAPLTAGGVALANQLAKSKGRAQLGFVNPLLYRLGRHNYNRVFRDVRVGDNDLGELIPESAGGGEPLGCCPAGRGYDMATGLGSPKLAPLAKRAARRNP